MTVISALLDITRSTKQDGQLISATETNQWSNRVIQITDGVKENLAGLETCYVGVSEPSDKPKGKLYCDTSGSRPEWTGYLAAGGSRATFQTTKNGYDTALDTAGSATFKPGGAIDVNTTQVSADSGNSQLQAYTVPGNTLSEDSAIYAIGFGTKTGTASRPSPRIRFSGSDNLSIQLPANTTDWMSRAVRIQTGVSSRKDFYMRRINLDNGIVTVGIAEFVDFNSGSFDPSSSFLVFGNTGSTVDSGDTVTQEIMITRLML